jgi:hypothetical protein
MIEGTRSRIVHSFCFDEDIPGTGILVSFTNIGSECTGLVVTEKTRSSLLYSTRTPHTVIRVSDVVASVVECKVEWRLWKFGKFPKV